MNRLLAIATECPEYSDDLHISSESSLWKGGLCQLSVEIRVFIEVTESLLGGREIFRDAEARSLEQSCHLVGVEKGFQGLTAQCLADQREMLLSAEVLSWAVGLDQAARRVSPRISTWYKSTDPVGDANFCTSPPSMS